MSSTLAEVVLRRAGVDRELIRKLFGLGATGRIRCPGCKVKPTLRDRWWCVPTCGTSWNTFLTGGVCPGCRKQWRTTQCRKCKGVFLHLDWSETKVLL